MSFVERAFPWPGKVALPELLDEFARTESLRPFADLLLRFGAQLSERLLTDKEARRFPALQALGFWTRPTALHGLKLAYERGLSGDVLMVPRGLAFHIPPANVDTIFVYSWIISFLIGNRNIVRLPTLSTPTVSILCRILHDLFCEGSPELARRTAMLRYGHDDAVTGMISAACDLRVVWGGDQTVNHIRSVPLSPHANEIVFGDRFSLAAFDATSVAALSEQALAELAVRFFNDSYWFDQLGCSSPRVVIWCGPSDTAEFASKLFYEALQPIIASKGYTVETGIALNKLSYAYRAMLDLPVREVKNLSNELLVITLEKPIIPRDNWYAAGTFLEMRLDRLQDLVPHLTRRDQTLTVFGFDAGTIRALGLEANGRGLDRIVPVGEALTFSHFWDGQDLLRSFSRLVHLRSL